MDELKTREKSLLALFQAGEDVSPELSKYLELVVALVEKKEVSDSEVSEAIALERQVHSLATQILHQTKEKTLAQETLTNLADTVNRLLQPH
ncbi:hypothetical protein NEDG_01284 [Nematocida displodere]|uniref:Uncharacterized protein n=1 Tax=Nematocida displodere TaxID=1805483 RepID=A0A177ECG9_9MICR|nr:hypothetical protein NEDG_01284 [Nematocida displodere]